MDQNKRQAVALMKYSAIAPLISGTQDDYGSLRAYYRDASARGVTAPDGQVRHYSPGTIQKWHLAYKSGGFDALLPTGRSDCGVSRKIDPGLEEEIRYIKDFQLQEGGCQVRLVNITDSNRCPILLEEGEVDLAITHKPPNSARFHCKKLGDEETWLIMGRDNPLACGAGDIDFLKEMGGQNVLFVSMETLREVEPILQEQGSVCTYLESDRVLLEQSIKSDGGVFSIPAHSRHNFMDGDMLARRLKNFPVVNGSYFLYERETPEVLQFIEYFCRQW